MPDVSNKQHVVSTFLFQVGRITNSEKGTMVAPDMWNTVPRHSSGVVVALAVQYSVSEAELIELYCEVAVVSSAKQIETKLGGG